MIIDENQDPDPWWMPASAELGPFVDALIARGRGGGITTPAAPGGWRGTPWP